MSAFDEIEIGVWIELGCHRFERDEIVGFAEAYDPQPFHLDEAAARESLLGGLCASGWHTAAVFMRLNVDRQQHEAERLRLAGRPVPVFGPSPGVSALRWMRPVRPGDTVTYRQRVVAKRESASRPGWGLLTTEVEAFVGAGGADPVFRMSATVLMRTD